MVEKCRQVVGSTLGQDQVMVELTICQGEAPLLLWRESFDETKSPSLLCAPFFRSWFPLSADSFRLLLNIKNASRRVVVRIARKGRLAYNNLTTPPSPNARWVGHTNVEARTYAAAAYSTSAITGSSLIRSH